MLKALSVFPRLLLALSLISVALAAPSAAVFAQGSTGIAAIASPAEGQAVSGTVTIVGTASHTQFLRYELHFAFEPNPTDTWFLIQDPVFTPVVEGALGQWNTNGIADGVYVLRLRVVALDGSTVDALVHNIRVQNRLPTETPLPTAIPIPTAGEAPAEVTEPVSPAATPTGALVILPPTSTPRSSATPGGAAQVSEAGEPAGAAISAAQFGQAFCSGVYATLVAFVLLAAYAAGRAALRPSGRRVIQDFIDSLGR